MFIYKKTPKKTLTLWWLSTLHDLSDPELLRTPGLFLQRSLLYPAMASLASSSGKKTSPFQKEIDKESRKKKCAAPREPDEEEEEEVEIETQVSTLTRTMSAGSSRSAATTEEQVLAACKLDPELLKKLIAQSTDEVADLVDLTRKEKEANRMMELDADEFKQEYEEEIRSQLIQVFGKVIEHYIKSDPKRRRFLNKADTHSVALGKLTELNDFGEKFGDVFQEAFTEIFNEFKDDFGNAFIGQYLGEIDEDEEDNDESSDYENGEEPTKKRLSSGGGGSTALASPAKKQRSPGAVLSPSSTTLQYGMLVETYVPNFGEWREAEVSNKTQAGYVSMSKAKTLLSAGMLRIP